MFKQMFKRKKTIFKKLLLTYMILIIALMSVLAVLLSWGYDNYVFRQKQDALRSAAFQTQTLLDSYRKNEISDAELNHSLDILSYMTDSRIYAIRINKEALNSKNLIFDKDIMDEYLVKDLKTILTGQEVHRKNQYSNKFATQVVFVGIPLKNQSQIEGAILLFAPVDEINATIARINMLIGCSALIAVILSGLIIYFISLKISKPLSRMEEGARRIAAGENIEDLSIKTGDELEKLAQAFNYMKDKIAAAESMRREFIASVSHDLKTPLTTISGFIQGMLDGLVKPEENPRYLRIIKEETQRLISLTGDILEQAKLQSGGISLSRKYLAVKDFLELTLENTGVRYNVKKIKIDLDCPEVGEIYADEARLKQIFLNILENALKFTPENGRIFIKVSESATEFIFRVRDNGQGIAPEDLPYIFEKFYRGDKSRPGSTGGTGLGLNITKTLVELHGGRIEVLSEAGQRTEIIIRLPK